MLQKLVYFYCAKECAGLILFVCVCFITSRIFFQGTPPAHQLSFPHTAKGPIFVPQTVPSEAFLDGHATESRTRLLLQTSRVGCLGYCIGHPERPGARRRGPRRRVCCCYGGAPIADQIAELKRFPHIIAAARGP